MRTCIHVHCFFVLSPPEFGDCINSETKFPLIIWIGFLFSVLLARANYLGRIPVLFDLSFRFSSVHSHCDCDASDPLCALGSRVLSLVLLLRVMPLPMASLDICSSTCFVDPCEAWPWRSSVDRSELFCCFGTFCADGCARVLPEEPCSVLLESSFPYCR